jgi:alkanesulfonate monooxygenase SsuD/methylene tetrahydromethanopterin reductase-like flavin-dependent oxidoreductase (luciferase family)
MRPALTDADVFPKTESGRPRTWVGVGGTPQSVIRTARHGLPLMLAIIGGPAKRSHGPRTPRGLTRLAEGTGAHR